MKRIVRGVVVVVGTGAMLLWLGVACVGCWLKNEWEEMKVQGSLS